MTTEQFVRGFYNQKNNLLEEYLSETSETEVQQLIKSLDLNNQQNEILKRVLDTSFTDIFYSILLGLDGCTAIGDLLQQQFTVLDENNNQVCGEIELGEVEALAYQYFQESE